MRCAIHALLLALVLALPGPAFAAEGQAAPVVELSTTAAELLDFVLAHNRIQEPELDVDAARAAFLQVVASARRALAGAQAPAQRIAVLNRAVLTERRTSYLSNQYWRDATLAASLVRRRGNCLSTSTLYLLVARACDLPVHLVLLPRHAFVRWQDDGNRINIETTNGGLAMPDMAYLADVPMEAAELGLFRWNETLDDRHLRLTVLGITASHLAGQQRHAEALRLHEDMRRLVPDRIDVRLHEARVRADATGDRAALSTLARSIADDDRAPSSLRVQSWQILANEHLARGEQALALPLLQLAFARAPSAEVRQGTLMSLAKCCRGLRDTRGALRYAELAHAVEPDDLHALFWLAAALTEDGRPEEGLAMIRRARAENPEDWFVALVEAGLLVRAGQREAGWKAYAAVAPPRTDLQLWECNRAWFLAVWGEPEAFYRQFEHALATATSPDVLSWIAEDDDLDRWRSEDRFKELVAACRLRLLGAGK